MSVPLSRLLSVMVAFSLAMVLVFTGRSSLSAQTSQHASKASMKTLRLAYYEGENGQLAATLDPAQISAADDFIMSALQYRGLVIIGTNDQVVPDLASKYTHSKDLKTWTFYIRKNARFANGHKVTAQDAKFSIERALSKTTGSQVAYYDALIKGYDAFNKGDTQHLSGVKVVNSTTLQVQITKPAAYFLKAFSYPINDVLDPAVVRGKESGQNNNYLTNNCSGNVSNGPFKLVCRGGTGPGSFYSTSATPKYTLVPNPKFYGPKPKIKLEIPAVSSTDVGYRNYLAGQLDETGVPTANLADAKKRPDYHRAPTSSIGYISLSTKLAPFNNVHCRLAVAYGLDRKAYVQVLHGASNPLYTILPPGFPSYSKLNNIPTFNLARAKSELAKCPGGASTPVTYVYNRSSVDSDNVANAITGMMTTVGFKWTAKGTTVHDWLRAVNRPLSETNTQAIRNGWAQDYPDPQDYISLLFHCGNSYDISEWCNSKFDKLTDQADTTANPKTRTKLYAQAQAIALKAGVPVMVSNAFAHTLINRRVHGLNLFIAWSDVVPSNLNWSKVTIS